MSRRNEWVGVADVKLKCPICAKPDWCMLHIDGKKVICPRMKSNVVLNNGFLHKVHDNGLKNHKSPNKRRSNHCINWNSLARQYFRKGYKNIGKMNELGRDIGISVETLRGRFGCGWDGEAYTVPCKDGAGDLVGIQRRFPDGHKVWVSRSRNGLFMPKMVSWTGNLFICEGFTDTAALVDMGFRAIGRANCQTGMEYIKNLLYHQGGISQVTIVGDNDLTNVHGNVGQRGAEKLARELYGGNYFVAVAEVPSEYKDMRQWYVKGGATKEHVIERSRRI